MAVPLVGWCIRFGPEGRTRILDDPNGDLSIPKRASISANGLVIGKGVSVGTLFLADVLAWIKNSFNASLGL